MDSPVSGESSLSPQSDATAAFEERLRQQNRRLRLVILINSTPKYYYLLPLHMELLHRYGGTLQLPDVVLATEEPDHPICLHLEKEYNVQLLRLAKEEAGFLDSRAEALEILQQTGKYDFVLPLQEDFLLDRPPMWSAIDNAALAYLDTRGYVSARLMPCPGPQKRQSEAAQWWDLDKTVDRYGFTFQATVWRLDACATWFRRLSKDLELMAPRATTDPKQRIELEVRSNLAEGNYGQKLFWNLSEELGWKHIAYRRAGPWANAVYLCPWPYRPTAIVKGKLEAWAKELAMREGMPLGDVPT